MYYLISLIYQKYNIDYYLKILILNICPYILPDSWFMLRLFHMEVFKV